MQREHVAFWMTAKAKFVCRMTKLLGRGVVNARGEMYARALVLAMVITTQ